MTDRPTSPDAPSNEPPPDSPRAPDSMREADIANGENPDDAIPHRTGEEQARINRENEPPA